MEKNHEADTQQEIYEQKLNHILDTELTAENINTYFDSALESVISLIDDIKNDSKYKWQTLSMTTATQKEAEDQLCKDALGVDVEEILDNIDAHKQNVDEIDDILQAYRQNQENITYIPPDKNDPEISSGNGNFESSKRLPKAKVTLFILQNNFGVDLNDKDQLQISTGILEPNMMRKTSYDVIHIPDINRLIFSCDEIGNKTFIIDTQAAADAQIGINDLKLHTKSQLDELLRKYPNIGSSINYSKNYPAKLLKVLSAHDVEQADDTKNEESYNPLKDDIPKAPEGWYTIRGLVNKYGVGYQTIVKLLEEGIQPKKFKNSQGRVCNYYELTLAEPIIEKFAEIEEAPEGWYTAYEIANKYRLDHQTTVKILEEEGIQPKKFKSSVGAARDYYELISVKPIIEKFAEIEEAPEGWYTVQGLADKYGVSHGTIVKLLAEKGIQPEKFKDSVGKVCDHYELVLIKPTIEKFTEIEEAPEGWYTAYGIANKYRLDHQTIVKLLEEGIQPKKFKNSQRKVYDYYELISVKPIIEKFTEIKEAPEGWYTVRGLVNKYRVGYQTIVKLLGEEGIQPKKFKSSVGSARDHYELKLVDPIIEKYINKREKRLGKIANKQLLK